MQQADRPEFNRQVSLLCAAYNVPIGDRAEAYWVAFNKLSLVEFARVVEHAIGPEGPERMPSIGALWGIRKSIKTRTAIPVQETPAIGDGLYGFSNRVMFQWLLKRVRAHGKLAPEMLQRVIEAKRDELAMFRALLLENDPEATAERFIRLFERRADSIIGMQEAA